MAWRPRAESRRSTRPLRWKRSRGCRPATASSRHWLSRSPRAGSDILMSGQRQDYILRQIDLLRQFVKRVVHKRPDPELDEALLLAMHLQEKLFPLPPAEFLRLDLAAQIA